MHWRLVSIGDRNVITDVYLSQNQLHNKLHCLRSMIRTTPNRILDRSDSGPQVGKGALNGLTGVPLSAFNCRHPQRPKLCEETTYTFMPWRETCIGEQIRSVIPPLIYAEMGRGALDLRWASVARPVEFQRLRPWDHPTINTTHYFISRPLQWELSTQRICLGMHISFLWATLGSTSNDLRLERNRKPRWIGPQLKICRHSRSRFAPQKPRCLTRTWRNVSI